jgi:hypothetical protein
MIRGGCGQPWERRSKPTLGRFPPHIQTLKVQPLILDENYMGLTQTRRWRSTISPYERNYEVENFIFYPSIHLFLWWLQSSEISNCSVVFNPHTLAAISMHDHALIFFLLIYAWSIIPKHKKHIWFRKYHMFIYVRNSFKKRKYLIVKLACTSSCERSLYSGCRCSGCINMWDVLINISLQGRYCQIEFVELLAWVAWYPCSMTFDATRVVLGFSLGFSLINRTILPS